MMNPTPPPFSKSHSLQNIQQKIPVHMIVSLINIQLTALHTTPALPHLILESISSLAMSTAS